MTPTIRVSDAFYDFVATHNRDDETMEETLRRLVGGQSPKDVAGILSSESATEIRERLDRKQTQAVDAKRGLRERFKDGPVD